jgi:hypothetical protein
MSALRLLFVLVPMLAAGSACAVEEGATGFSLSLAPGRQLDRTYTVISGRLGYYFVRDFEGSVALEAWRGNDPKLYKVVPELRYVLPLNPRANPYGAVFLSRTFYDGLPDRYTYGVRAGVYFTLNRGSRLGVGVVHERIESCDPGTYRDCRQNYPEVGLHFTF